MKPLTPTEKQYVAQVFKRKRVYDTHVFDDETDFCIRCGQHVDPIVDQLIECFGQPGVIAISHLRAAKRETEVTYSSGNIFKDLDVEWHEPDRATRARLGITDDDVQRMRSAWHEPYD